MNEEKAIQKGAGAKPQPKPETTPTEPNASMPSQDVGWARASTSQVVRTVAIALLTTAVVLGALFLLWQVRTFIGWFVITLFLAAVLNPAVNWLQRRHRLMKRPLAIGLTYLGVLVALLLVVGIFLPVLVDQINGLAKFVSTAANAPQGPTDYIKGLAKQNGLGGLFQRFSDQLADLRKQLGGVLQNLFSSSGQIAVSAAGFVAALATVLTLTFFLLLGSERYVNAGVGLFPEAHQPLVRRLLSQSAGAISGYITGNLAIPVAEIIRIVVTELLAYRRMAPEANEPAVASPSTTLE
jgi:predicted PurR-regulated permease PerM